MFDPLKKLTTVGLLGVGLSFSAFEQVCLHMNIFKLQRKLILLQCAVSNAVLAVKELALSHITLVLEFQ